MADPGGPEFGRRAGSLGAGCCFLCSNGCRIDIAVKDDRPGGRIVGVRGREADVVNRGRLGPKGLYSWVANGSVDAANRVAVADRMDGTEQE